MFDFAGHRSFPEAYSQTEAPKPIDPSDSPYALLVTAASLIPVHHYLLAFTLIWAIYLYQLLELHILRDLFTGFRGQTVDLTHNSCSDLYQEVISKCRILHGRYLSTPWLTSPHIQTLFLAAFGRPPVVSYKRQLFRTPDGGTLALDWLMSCDVSKDAFHVKDAITADDKTPIVIVIPGLSSDSTVAYIKHFAFVMAKSGWNVLVMNHRGLGGISITSDCFYNGGWTEDTRKVIGYINNHYPQAPLFIVGTSIGANVLVKFLGEEGINTPICGAAAVCNPWDLLLCDRFINRSWVQRVYNKALVIGLKGYAKLHQTVLCRLANWDDIVKSRYVRDFDRHSTRVLGKFETVDAYYRHASSVNVVGNVMVPLLCISSFDDPVCSREAIPWDECRANKNIVLATTQHGGHLAYYEGITAKSMWWVRAVHEFLIVLHSSSLIRREKEVQIPPSTNPDEPSIDEAPYLGITEDGMVTAIATEQTTDAVETNDEPRNQIESDEDMIREEINETGGERNNLTEEEDDPPSQSREQKLDAVISPIRRRLDQLSRRSGISVWLLAYIAVITTWPVLGSAVAYFYKRKLRNALPAASRRK